MDSDTRPALKPGTRLRSQVSDTEVVVVRPGGGTVNLTCGGAVMVPLEVAADHSADHSATLAATLADGPVLGKRYTAVADPSIEVLVTKAGAGTLGDGRTPLVLKEAKALPASD